MTSTAEMAKLTVLVDNHGAGGLAAEHGFSLAIDTACGRVLFDTGLGPALQQN